MINLSLWEFPLSFILAAATVCGTVICANYADKYRILRFLSGRAASATLLTLLTILTAIEGTWKFMLFRSTAFLILVFLTIFCLGLTVIKEFKGSKRPSFILNHLGFFLVLYGGFFGAPDFSDSQMAVYKGTPSHTSYSQAGDIVPLPFDVSLDSFTIDYYDDGKSPKQYTSLLNIDGEIRKTSVNHPCRHKGYTIYQSGYDVDNQQYSIIKFVRDPWLPLIFLGAVMMVAGALMSLGKTWRSKAFIPSVLALAAVFCAISLARIKFGTLMPALRSLWFIPHIVAYMLAYSLMAIALILCLYSLIGKKDTYGAGLKLFNTSSGLLLVGMMCGAFWAKAAWGDYWMWDAKECWAAVTWMMTLIVTHIPCKNRKVMAGLVLLSFLAIQITWYGVNYLPASQYSMHTYNR